MAIKSSKDPNLEYVDSTPMAIPFGMSRPESLQEQMARMIRTTIRQYAVENDMETFEEADDFDCNDEGDLLKTQYEVHEMEEEVPAREFERLEGAREVKKENGPRKGPGSKSHAKKEPPPEDEDVGEEENS